MPSKIKEKKRFSITKKIAKHGNQAIIVIPKILEDKLKPGTIVELSINIINETPNEKNDIYTRI